MSESAAKPGQMVEVGPLGKLLQAQQQTLLIRTNGVEIIQLVIPAGEQVPTHEAQGEIILHCLEGHVTLAVGGESRELKAGQLLYLIVNEPFSIQGIEAASLLATIILPREGSGVDLIGDSTRPRRK